MVAPEVTISVQEHPTGAETVTVTLLDGAYPANLLRQQCESIGAMTGSPLRGLNLVQESLGQTQDLVFLRASFATDNLINLQTGEIALDVLVRAFLGAPEPHTLDSFLITIGGVSPGVSTIRTFRSRTAVLEGDWSADLGALEYRILVLNQDPDELDIPRRHVEETEEPAAEHLPSPNRTPLLLGLVVLAGGSTGALVYFALSRRPRASSSPRSRKR